MSSRAQKFLIITGTELLLTYCKLLFLFFTFLQITLPLLEYSHNLAVKLFLHIGSESNFLLSTMRGGETICLVASAWPYVRLGLWNLCCAPQQWYRATHKLCFDIIIDREAGEIIRLVASVCLSVCLSVLSCLNLSPPVHTHVGSAILQWSM